MEQAAKQGIDRLAALDEIRARWLGHLAHDFRGPLFAARGYAKLLLDDQGQNVTVTQREYLHNILDALNKLTALVDSIREFPAPGSLRLELVNVAGMLRSISGDWRSREKTLQLTETIPPGPIFAAADREKLALAVHKLLGEAVEFSRPGGEVQLHARLEEGELTMRLLATRDHNGAPPVPLDASVPCEILRLHGGVAHVGAPDGSRFHATLRLPLITSGSESL